MRESAFGLIASAPAIVMKNGKVEWQKKVDALASEVERARANGNPRDIAASLRKLADVERRPPWGRAAAVTHYEEAIALLRGLDEPLDLSHAIRHLGIVHEQEGDREKAEAAYDEALAIYRSAAEKGSELDHANALRYPAAVKWQLNKPDESFPLWAEACERYELAGIAEGVAESAGRLALIAHEAGDHAAAIDWYNRAKTASARTADNDTLTFIKEIESELGI